MNHYRFRFFLVFLFLYQTGCFFNISLSKFDDGGNELSKIVPTLMIKPSQDRLTHLTSAAFVFEVTNTLSSEAYTFQCQLNDETFKLCDSPHNLSSLPLGNHTLSVKVIDSKGLESLPVSYDWSVLDRAWNYFGEPNINNGKYWSYSSFDLDSKENVYVVIYESPGDTLTPTTGVSKVYYWNKSNWIQMGGSFNTGNDSGSSLPIKVSVDIVSDSVFVAYLDTTNSNLVTVEKWNGTNWTLVGTPGLGSSLSTMADFVVARNGQPYLVAAGSQSVLTWNGSAWITVGSANYTSDSVTTSPITKLMRGPSGDVFVFFYSGTASEYKLVNYSGGTWQPEILAPFTLGVPGNIFITSAGTPYAAFNDSTNSYKLKLVKWSGSTWNVVSADGPSTGESFKPIFSEKPTGEIVISFNDRDYAYLVSTFEWNGNSWTSIGPRGWSFSNYTPLDAKHLKDGTPLILVGENSAGTSLFSYRINRAAISNTISTVSPLSSLGIQLNWETSKDPALTKQEIQLYSDEFCGTKSGSLSDVASSSATSTNSTGTNSTLFTFRIKSSFSLGEPSWSLCSNEIGFSNIWTYLGGAKPFVKGNPFWDSEPAGFAVSPAGNVYVAYVANTGSASVMKWDGNTWSILGTENLTPNIWNALLAVDSNEQPVLFYPDSTAGWSGRGKQWNGSSWQPLASGSTLYSGVYFSAPAMAMYNNIPYVVYPNAMNSTMYSPSVSYLNGSSWAYLGTQQIINHLSRYPAIAVAPPGSATAGNVYISYEDGAVSNKISVSRYNGSAWSLVGTAGF